MIPAIAADGRSIRRILPLVTVCMLGVLLAFSGQSPAFVGLLIGLAAYAGLAWLCIQEPLILIAVFLFTLEIFPPFYIDAFGETPIFLSFLLLPIALAVVVVRYPDIRFSWDPIARGLALLLVGTALSIPFAFWLSGTSAGISSLSRWLLLAHIMPVFYLIRGFADRQTARFDRWIFRFLLIGATLAAVYGIVDFWWPVPLAHPAADQFIWLEGAVIRRAQGPFYESSNFANFCGFFLIAASTAFLAKRERYLGHSRAWIIVCISSLSLAVLVAFSRSAWASILTGLLACFMVSRFIKVPRALAVLCAVLVPLCFVWMFAPDLWDYLVSARIGRLFLILEDPNSATSGRFETWVRVVSIMRDQPQYLVFGIGYKTLTLTRLFHAEIVTDNGYLSLLLESGLAGFTGFLFLSGAILKRFFKLSRSNDDQTAFWSTVLFSIWCGELVQLLAADAYTYWRNMTIFAALMSFTLNIAERNRQAESS